MVPASAAVRRGNSDPRQGGPSYREANIQSVGRTLLSAALALAVGSDLPASEKICHPERSWSRAKRGTNGVAPERNRRGTDLVS
jgi:hypothetical protein